MFMLTKKFFVLSLFISFGTFLFSPISILAQEFSFFKSQEIGGLPGAVFTAIADFNNDSNLDLAIASSHLSSNSIFLGNVFLKLTS